MRTVLQGSDEIGRISLPRTKYLRAHGSGPVQGHPKRNNVNDEKDLGRQNRQVHQVHELRQQLSGGLLRRR